MMPLPGSAPVPPQGPTAPAAKPPPKEQRLTPDQASAWRRRIKAALEATKPALDEGKKNIDRYNAQHLGTVTDKTVAVPTDFYYIEQKKPQLFYRLPDVYLKALQPGLDDGGVIFQAALNSKIGPAGVNVLPKVQEVLFDVICATGFGALKVGYEPIIDGTKPFEVSPASQDPLTGAPVEAVVEEVPNIIASRYFIERGAPGDLIVPADFSGSDFDDAAYLGIRFREDLPDGEVQGKTSEQDDDRRLTPLPDAGKTARRHQRIGTELFFKARTFGFAKHPDAIWTFTLYDDDPDSTPVTVKPCPYQKTNPQTGRLEGMVGFPIVPLTTRYVSDTWMARSDCSMAQNSATELSTGRTQMIQYRDRNMPQWGFDTTRVDADIQAKIARNESMAGIGFNGPGADATWPIVKGQMSRENFSFNDYIQQDLNRIWGITDQGTSARAESAKTATEIQTSEAASKTRMEAERAKVVDWYLKVVAKFGALLQMFADETEYVELVGQDAQRLKNIPPEIQQQAAADPQAKLLVPWTKDEIFGRYSFQVKPDSQLHTDVTQEREQWLKFFNFLANEPTCNRTELTREGMKLFHYDPVRFTQPPPEHKPEPPKLSLAFTGEDFVAPQAPIMIELAAQLGLKISPEAILQSQQMLLQAEQIAAQQQVEANAQTEHGGAAKEAPKINKHPTEATGGMQGSGAPAPLGPGSTIQ
ncbi:MAG TPA: hypothetical protein VK467_04085 [Gemmatimonadales bacterium]|nr:hypothetical protein [Gemmatimonadales bacterium]